MNEWIREIMDPKKRPRMPIMTYPGLKPAGLGFMDCIKDHAALRYQPHRFP